MGTKNLRKWITSSRTGFSLSLPSYTFANKIFFFSQQVSPEDIEVVFDDVKGCDEAKKELQEIVEFLMNPDKFSKLGGKLPKGVLLSGIQFLLINRGVDLL